MRWTTDRAERVAVGWLPIVGILQPGLQRKGATRALEVA